MELAGIPSFDLLDEVDNSGLKVAVVRTALELDLFTAVHRGASDVPAIAAALSASERGTRVLVRALLSLGLLERDQAGAIVCSDTARAYLVEGATGDNRLIFLAWMRNRDRLPDAVRSGQSVGDHAAEDAQDEWTSYAAPHLVRWPVVIEGLVDRFRDRGLVVDPGAAVLDLGCGSGVVGLALVRDVPDARLVGVDRPAVLRVASELAAAMGVTERVEFREGDAETVQLEDATYDVVLLINVAQYLDDDALAKVLARCRTALRPGGVLYLSTAVVDDGTPGYQINWVFAVEMFLNSSVDQRSEAELRTLLNGAGFSEVTHPFVTAFVARV